MARGKPLSSDLRNLIISAHKNGKSCREISKNMSIPRATVQDIVNLFKNTNNIAVREKTGRPTILNDTNKRALTRIIKENRRSTAAEITVKLRTAIKKNISVSTCSRAMKKSGYRFYKVYLTYFNNTFA